MKAQREMKIGFNIKIGKHLEMILFFNVIGVFFSILFQQVLDNYFVVCLF